MAARLTFGELRRGAVAWVREDFKRSLRVGAISFGHRAPWVGVEIPQVEDAMAAVQKPLDAFNRAVASSGRTIESMTRNPDGSISMRLRPR